MNVLITGGAGYIGSHTVVELAATGHNPIILDSFVNSDRSVLKRIQAITGRDITCYGHDYQDSAFVGDILEKEQVDGVIHFAAYKLVGESVDQPLKYYRNNVAGLVGLLDVVEKHHIPYFVFSSSCTMYGEPDHLPLTEESPVKPAVSPYGATKLMGETILADTTHVSSSLRSMRLRYFNPIGAHASALIGELPKGRPTILVPFITQTVSGWYDQLTVFGGDYPTPDGTCIRDYIHVVDLARAHTSALSYLAKQKPGVSEVCNIGTGTGNSVLDIIKTFEKVTGKKVPYVIGPRRPGDVTANYAAVDKAHSLLGWKAEKTLADALTDAWRWQLECNKHHKTTGEIS